MKAFLSKIFRSGAVLVLLTAPIFSFSQEKKEKIRIRIEQDIDGKVKVDEKVINSAGLSEAQKEGMIEKFKDSVMSQNKGKAQGIKVEIDNETDVKRGDRKIEKSYNYNNDNGNEEIIIREKPQVRIYKKKGKDGGEWLENEDFTHEFNGNMESLRDNMKQMGKDLKFEFRSIPDNFMFDGGNSGSKTIKSIDVFPNNPKTEILNVRFNAPQKGDVSIKVLDVKGSVVAKEEIKDFSGEYVGQINIGKQNGTVFVMITQGEDGTVKRVVLPSKEK
ncbi:hypothetical protein EMA8858_02995 [Emticicia aquatica]|uniref:Secretion system C-terminal sorting domain-containing protein n=1 Tax=Emticicia aquatica TaxID=1681835 RepID=A0ABN8EYK2_9BACT|nr:T9SS type A sorting domain-containing protein [Emticicia aquatica]CAH0996860.1 hypothetical protein EMA8858_02995 [Emticicia aquatica]